MELPAVLPAEFQALQKASSEESLYNLVVENPKAILPFFEAACNDETWSDQHPEFMRRLIRFLTDQAFNDQLEPRDYQFLVHLIQRHYINLKPMMDHNLHVALSDSVVPVNSLLFSSISDLFWDNVRIKRDNPGFKLHLPIDKEKFDTILDLIRFGDLPTLWKKGQSELLELMDFGVRFRIPALVDGCGEMMQKYLSSENVFDLLKLACKQEANALQRECMAYINDRNSGFILTPVPPSGISIEFNNFSDETLDLSAKLTDFIVKIVGRGASVNDPVFAQILKRNYSNPIELDIHSSDDFSVNLEELPTQIIALNLSQCSWLSFEKLRQFADLCPSVENLNLAYDVQLNFLAWGELLKFQRLQRLDLSECTQLKNDDLKIVLLASKNLTHFSLENCRKIDDSGFFELTRSLSKLVHLNLANCLVTDATLAEIGLRLKSLQYLNLSHCQSFSIKGIQSLVKQAYSLKTLVLSNVDLADEMRESIKKINPLLDVL